MSNIVPNKPFKLIVAGSRSFQHYDLLRAKLDFFLSNKGKNIEVVSGRAQGADLLGEMYAKERGLKIQLFPADWKTYGKMAGILRNAQMAEYADALVAFWDGRSRGTQNMIQKMKLERKVVRIISF